MDNTTLLSRLSEIGQIEKAGEGIRTPDGLLGRHIAPYGVAARVARGAKVVQLSSRELAVSKSPIEPNRCPL